MTCASDEEIAGFVAGQLPSAESRRIAEHLDVCALCRELVALVGTAEPTRDAAKPRREIAPGEYVGRFIVLGLVGKGGMGRVFAAHDPDLDRKVALKLVHADTSGGEVQGRLMREAQAMARLHHPEVITVYEVGTLGDAGVFIAMELVDGGTLRSWLHAERRSVSAIVERFARAGDGLAAAHAVGLVHRDFKPDNVLVGSDGRQRVTDFGLARSVPGHATPPPHELSPTSPFDASLTVSGVVVGTPAYMAPEQLDGDLIDGRADQFSLCVALYQALYGELPFAGDNARAIRAAIARNNVRPAPRRSRVRGPLRAVLLRGLKARPDDRFPSMSALVAALRQRARPRLAPALGVVGALLVAAGAVATTVLLRAHHPQTGPQPVVDSVRRLTFAPGCEGVPSFAPDGKTLVYHHGAEDGDIQLYALDLASGNTRQLTRGPGVNQVPAVSPDGHYLAYVHDGDGPRQLRVQRLDGNDAPRTIAPMPMGGRSVWLSPTIAGAFDGDGNMTGWSIDGATARPHTVRLPRGRSYWAVSTLGDGALATGWSEDEDHFGIGVLAHGGLRVLAEHVPRVSGGDLVAAPSGEAVYFTRRNGAIDELVRVPRNGGELQVLGGGVTPSDGMTIAADGSKLAFSTCKHNYHSVRVGDDDRPVPLMPPGDWNDFPAPAVDQRHFLFTSNRSGSEQAYLFDSTTKEVKPISPGGIGLVGDVSKDGRWFVHPMRSPSGIWVRSVDGSAPPRRLTDGVDDSDPVFSHDDGHVIFERGPGNDLRLWIVPVAGGAPRPLVATPSQSPMTSPVDDRVFFVALTPAESRLMMTNEHGAQPVPAPVPPSPRSAGMEWSFVRSRDGQRILFVHAGYEIREVDVDEKRPLRIKHRLRRWITWVQYAADDEHVIASLDFSDGDLWLAEGRFP
jgi:Tol biopolymer transport system component